MNLCHHPKAQKSQKNGSLNALKYHLLSIKETAILHTKKKKEHTQETTLTPIQLGDSQTNRREHLSET